MEPTYVSRLDAARKLKVSLRTLDRNIRKNRLKIKRDGKNIFILESDLFKINKDHPIEQELYMGSIPSSEPRNIFHGGEMSDSMTMANLTPDAGVIFKNLFEEAQKQLTKKEEKIELLNYKLGQMEMKLKQSVPLLEHKKEYESTYKRLQEKEKYLYTLTYQIKMMRLIKNIYLVVLVIVLMVAPFVLIFLNR